MQRSSSTKTQHSQKETNKHKQKDQKRKKMLRNPQQRHSINPKTQPLELSYFIPFLFIFFSVICNHGRLIQARIFIYSECSQDSYQPNSRYETNLNSLLSSIVSSSSQTLYNAFAFGNDSSAAPQTAAYGLYQCRGDLKTSDCATCIAGSINQIELLCPHTYGAALQLERCYVRYENADFLGKADDGVRYQKCSSSSGDGGEFLRRRDEVLDDLGGAVNGFRVSVKGNVEGYAQCFGDLSEAECSSCFGDAVAQVKNLCGSAAAGEVYLAQCYVRYWESGYYDSSPDSSNRDGAGKTVAISVGIVAGIAILIILLSLCKRSLS